MKAQRHEGQHFPHYNLGRAHEALGRLEAALEHYRLALAENPGYALARKAIERVQRRLAAHSSDSR